MGTYYALGKRSGTQMALERLKRLCIPLIFGMAVIIPPQIYFERLAKHQFNGLFFDFWPSKAFIGIYPEGNISWNHLWFIAYLMLFSLLLIPVFLKLKNNPNYKIVASLKHLTNNPLRIYLFAIPLYLSEAFLEPYFPETHALVGDWFTIINSIILFFIGFALIMVKDTFWSTVEANRKSFLLTGIVCFSLMLFITHNYPDSYTRHYIEAFVTIINLWSWILALFGFAARYLNKKSKLLSYSNEAVYPLYILHQTVMIGIGYYLININWSLGLKLLIMIVGTFSISLLLHELFIRRWKILRPLFGLKRRI